MSERRDGPPSGFRSWKVGTKLILLTIPLIAAASLVAAFVAHQRSDAFLKEKLAHRARSLIHQIMADRAYYASVVVPRVGDLGGTLGADYQHVSGRFPLPATFVREVSEATAELKNGYTANLISPWPINKDKGIKEEFQREGFRYLMEGKGDTFVRTDTVDGKAVMRVLAADRASAKSCVSCHNAHPDSPKHDFQRNDVMGGLEITMPMERYLQESRQEQIFNVVGSLGMCVLVFGILALGTRGLVTRPLGRLEDRMKVYVDPDGDGHSSQKPPETSQTSGDEVTALAGAFERMQAVITAQQQKLREANATLEQRVVERTEELRRTMEEKERIGSELRIASEIQKSILPRTFPAFPQRDDFSIYAETIPAWEMGGDFYDFFLIDEHHLGVVIADVSGKGVPAAIFMAVSRSLLKATALKGVTPAECLTHVNRLLCPENDSAMFVTVFYGILDTETGELLYSNAGHNVPYVLRQDGRTQLLDNTGGMALGVVDEATFFTKRTMLSQGDALFLYTDGVTEAMDPEGALFSEARLEACLQQNGEASPYDLIQLVVQGVRTYAASASQADDITLLALRYGNGESRR